jgi:arsenate reductase-like glutaredoxin family protein
MEVFGIRSCDTCRKAEAALRAKGYDVAFRDVRKEPLNRSELAAFEAAFGADIVNHRSTTWRGLSDAEKALPAVEALIAHPTLMKRPVISHGGVLTLGWGNDVQAQYLA